MAWVGLRRLRVVVHRAIWWSLVGRRAVHSRLGLIGEVVRMKVSQVRDISTRSRSLAYYGEYNGRRRVEGCGSERAAVLQKKRASSMRGNEKAQWDQAPRSL